MSSQKYFNALNYSLANEDSFFERKLVKVLKPRNVVSVCGAGSRCTALVSHGLEEINCVDLSGEQLHLAQLRFEAIKTLEFEDFLKFWGYAPYTNNNLGLMRQKAFLEINLTEEARIYLSGIFQENQWGSLLYLGKWERTFDKLSRIVRKVIGKNITEQLFEFQDIQEQRKYVDERFPKLRWKLIMLVLGNKALFNKFLYKGSFIKKNVKESYLSYYSKAYDELMKNHLFKNNFFLQMCFLGKVRFQEANPPEATKECFEEIKEVLKTAKVHYYQQDIISFLKTRNKEVDLVSISDVPSYFSGDLEKNFLQLMKSAMNDSGVIVNRNYLRVPSSDKRGYSLLNNEYQELIQSEQVQMYRIEVLRYED